MISVILALALVLALLGGDARAPESPPDAGLPWLRGFPAVAVADEPSLAAELRLHAWQAPDADCLTSTAGAFQLAADVAPAAGVETVLVSYTAGIVVLDARGKKLAAHRRSRAGARSTGSSTSPPAICSSEIP